MKKKRASLIKRAISSIIAFSLSVSMLSTLPASADEEKHFYPYMLFAGSSDDGAIVSTASNICINGNVATNGTLSFGNNYNINGTITEHAGETTPIIFDQIDDEFFSEDVDYYTEDYSCSDINITIIDPIVVNGEIVLDGNVSINSGIKTCDDITLTGEVNNTNNSVICSQYGDINIESINTNLGGLIYAPCGTVSIIAQNLNLNNVIIIADKIIIDAPSVNMNSSTSMAQFVGEAIASNNIDTELTPELYAFGKYNEDEATVTINWYSNVDGEFYILKSSDNIEYTTVAEANGSNTYEYSLPESFDTLFFKVAVTNDDKSAESIPFKVTKSDNAISVELLDSDEDGLPDVYEVFFGTDLSIADTDNDGLTDYQEVYNTGTDPIKYDSVSVGISDYDADSDNDGLSNGNELLQGTDAQNRDSDNDGLNDGEEINIYETDPLVSDSDGDSLPDGDEIHIGLNPSNPKTFGSPDEEYVIEQSISYNSPALAAINTEDNPYEMTITFNAAGYAENAAAIDVSSYSNAIRNDATFGAIAQISYNSACKYENGVLYYRIKDNYVPNSDNPYADYTDAFDGIKRFQAFKFDEVNNVLMPVKTEYDVATNTVSCEVENGTYCLIDFSQWLYGLGYGRLILTKQPVYNIPINGTDLIITEQYEAETENSRLMLVSTSAPITWMQAKDLCEQNGGHLMTISRSYEQEPVVEMLKEHGLSDSYWIGATEVEGEFKWITGEQDLYDNWGNGQPDSGYGDTENYVGITKGNHEWGTFGQWNDFRNDDEIVCGYICEWDNIETEAYNILVGTNLKKMTILDGQLEPGSSIDTDNDGLTDWEEVKQDSSFISWDNEKPVFKTTEEGWSELLSINSFIETFLEGCYFYPSDYYNDKLIELDGFTEYLNSLYIVPFLSDPTDYDTDKDGYDDYYETNETKTSPSCSNVNEEIGLSRKEYINIEYHNNFVSYGGNQKWFPGTSIEELGCGVIASCDILIYLGLAHYNTYSFTPMILYNEDGSIKYNPYRDFVLFYFENYYMPINELSSRGTIVASEMEKYLNNYGINASVSWSNFDAFTTTRFLFNYILSDYNEKLESDKELYNQIIKMLKNDIPVMLSIGSSVNNGEGIPFYSTIIQCERGISNNYYSDHYVTITAVYYDDIANDYYLEISSWGKKYYVSFNQYNMYRDIFSGELRIII